MLKSAKVVRIGMSARKAYQCINRHRGNEPVVVFKRWGWSGGLAYIKLNDYVLIVSYYC